MRHQIVAIALLACSCSSDAIRAERAFREGRFQEALEAFAKAESAAGSRASPELLHNQALAALRAGDLSQAEACAKKAAALDGGRLAALADFLLGNAAFSRCEIAEVQASSPEAEPFAFDVAISQAENARNAWERAVVSKGDWPEARRNVERALLKLELLRKKKEEAVQPPRQEGEPPPKVVPIPPDQPDEMETSEEVPKIEPQWSELSPEQLAGLLERLAEKETEKLELRAAHARERRIEVEKDW